MWKDKRPHIILWSLLLLGFMLRAGYGLLRNTDLAGLPDQQEYVLIAQSVLNGGGFAFVDERFGQQVLAYRTPGYPLFVAAMGANVHCVRLAQAALDASVIAAVWILLRRVCPGKNEVAWIAAGLILVHPLLIHFSSLVLTETVSTALLAWSLALFTSQRKRAIGIAAMLLVAAAMVRPSFWLLFVVLVAGRIVTLPVPWSRRAMLAIAVSVMALAVEGAWVARNMNALGKPILTTTNGGVTFYDGFNPDADGSSNQKVFLQDMPFLAGMGELDRDGYLQAKAWAYIAENPSRVLSLAGSKLARTFSPVPLAQENRTTLYWSMGLVFLLPLMLAAAGGVYQSVIPPKYRVMLVIPVVLLAVAHAISVGSMRYRVPLEPVMCILAAGLVAGINKKSSSKSTGTCAEDLI